MEDRSSNNITKKETTASDQNGIRKKFKKPLMIVLLTLAVVFGILISFQIISRPYDATDNTFLNITIEEGEAIETVASRLEDEGIVSDASTFLLVCKMKFLTNFKSGTYYLSPSMDSVQIANVIVHGLTTSNGFTIPPGYTIDQIAASLARDGFIDKDKFLLEAGDKFFEEIDFIGKDVSGVNQIEGFLLPDEYVISSDADEAMIIFTMLDKFNNFFNDDYKARAAELGLTTRQVVALASIIEIETNISSERGIISGILHNRLNLDLEALPEIPLCSPSKESIFAALYPEESNYIYYVLSDKLDGSHQYVSSEAEYMDMLAIYEAAVIARDQERAENDYNE